VVRVGVVTRSVVVVSRPSPVSSSEVVVATAPTVELGSQNMSAEERRHRSYDAPKRSPVAFTHIV
jgi:hypothetical protein